MPDNREWAILIWLGIAFLWFMSKEGRRADFEKILHTVLKPKILVMLGAMLSYVALEVWLGSKLSIWRSDMVKPTIIWLVLSGLALAFSFNKASEEPHFFRRTVIGALGITAFLEFFMNLSVLNLLGELILLPILVVLVGISVVTDETAQDQTVKKLVDGLQSLIGFSLFVFISWRLYSNWSEINYHAQVLQLALPIWLTVGFLPFIYFFALYANYELAFMRINMATNDRKARWRARLAFFTKLHFRIHGTRGFAGYWPKEVASAPNFTAARHVVAQFQQSHRDEKQAAVDEADRLRRYTGSNGTDAEGRRLDRREFKETMNVLRWLATCQMGWYQNEEWGRYRPDLLDMIVDFALHGLPSDSGITMDVSEDGQAWYVWRRTVTGWCFAIGATGPPPDQWEYDGPEPPSGFPGTDHHWGQSAFSDEVNPNWVF